MKAKWSTEENMHLFKWNENDQSSRQRVHLPLGPKNTGLFEKSAIGNESGP